MPNGCSALLVIIHLPLMFPALARRPAAGQIFAFHRIVCFLFQENINVLMQFIPLINERSKSTHFFLIYAHFTQ